MRLALALAGCALVLASTAAQQTSPIAPDIPDRFDAPTASYDYVKRDVMIPMRDGVRLHTVIVVPKAARNAPMLLTRTPYNASARAQRNRSPHIVSTLPLFDELFAADGYIRVYQDIRGLHRSEGQWVLNRPLAGPDEHDAVLEGRVGEVPVERPEPVARDLLVRGGDVVGPHEVGHPAHAEHAGEVLEHHVRVHHPADVELPGPRWESQLRTQRVDRRLNSVEVPAAVGLHELEVDAERRSRCGLHGDDRALESSQRHSGAGEGAKSSCLGHGGDELGRGRPAGHRGLDDRVPDA
jgi:hypothetical protein